MSSGYSCFDINECENLDTGQMNRCPQYSECINVYASYECACYDGFVAHNGSCQVCQHFVNIFSIFCQLNVIICLFRTSMNVTVALFAQKIQNALILLVNISANATQDRMNRKPPLTTPPEDGIVRHLSFYPM